MSGRQHPSRPANRQVSTSESLLLNHAVLCDGDWRLETKARDVLVGRGGGQEGTVIQTRGPASVQSMTRLGKQRLREDVWYPESTV